MDKPTLAIIIPCYNEELCVNTTVETLLNLLDSLVEKGKIKSNSYLYLVDDGSKDRTWSLIVALNQIDKRVKALKFIRNFGNNKWNSINFYYISIIAIFKFSNYCFLAWNWWNFCSSTGLERYFFN